MKKTYIGLVIGALLIAPFALSGCAHASDISASANHEVKPDRQENSGQKNNGQKNSELKPYNADANSMVEIDKALARARVRGTKVLVVMGANWCHDSRGLAGRLAEPEFQTLIAKNYELVYVSAGTDPGQNDQNRAVSKRFGVDAIEGTPTVFIARPDGTLINKDSAGYWRNADKIPTDMSYAYFDMYAQK